MPTTDKIKRQRGRPSTAPAPAAATYDGPTLDAIIRLTDEQVQASFKELGVEPSPFRWNEDDPELNVAHWFNFGVLDSSQPTGPVDLAKLKADSLAIHNECLRMELLWVYLTQWIDSLSDEQLIAEVERLSEDQLSVSEKRYAKKSELKERVQQLTWPVLVKESKLRVPIKNPITGEEV
jgi:hypothetical protein